MQLLLPIKINFLDNVVFVVCCVRAPMESSKASMTEAASDFNFFNSVSRVLRYFSFSTIVFFVLLVKRTASQRFCRQGLVWPVSCLTDFAVFSFSGSYKCK